MSAPPHFPDLQCDLNCDLQCDAARLSSFSIQNSPLATPGLMQNMAEHFLLAIAVFLLHRYITPPTEVRAYLCMRTLLEPFASLAWIVRDGTG